MKYVVEKKFNLTKKVYCLILKNPCGQVFDFLPGQFIIISREIETKDGRKTIKRSYSIASSPTNKEHIELAIKYKEEGTMSKSLKRDLKEGDELEIQGPYGHFHLDELDKDIVFMAGGVCITPLMSMIRYIRDKDMKMKQTMILSSKSVEEITYKKELEDLAKNNKDFKIIHTLTQWCSSDWEGCTGRIDSNLIKEKIKNPEEKKYYLCGPRNMVKNMSSILLELGVDPKNIKKEAW